MHVYDPDEVARVVLNVYSTLAFKPPGDKFTILAAFLLWNTSSDELKIISLATGSKCLPEIRLCEEGDVLHDSHAEVLARRSAIRWFLEEVDRSHTSPSDWIDRPRSERFALRSNVQVVLYVSTVPCGDASMRYLASFQDAEMAALKDSSQFPVLPPNVASRGRDNYSLFGVLRTKPGRADSPPTRCMSCSDKIASWNVLGFQGALASRILEPLYLDHIVIGDVDDSLQSVVHEDCERAFWRRLEGLDVTQLPTRFSLRRPTVSFTMVRFVHSSLSLGLSSSCNDSLCWTADSTPTHEVLINGLKRGVPPKHRHNPKFRPRLCKLSLFNLYRRIAASIHTNSQFDTLTYRETKQSMADYQAAKAVLQGPNGPFAGWIKTGSQWESFDFDGIPREPLLDEDSSAVSDKQI
ncbi:unnamed protein product [Somion occarium]|uniref:A to I editase domain-containing protein n=1 Tax=Somion occarium TaxID=3059160 RepID=A0ABP1D131_9APHY